MSDNASKKAAGDADGRTEGAALYVYCVGERAELEPLLSDEGAPAAIEESGALETAGAGALAAVVSAVPLADYGEAALEARMKDAAWTATRAMRHERAVEFFARRASVVPLRFGTIYLTRERVAAMLDERGAELTSILGRLRGREEWGVNVYFDRARLKETVVELSPRLRELAGQASAAAPGQAYLLRKKIDAMRTDEARAEVRRVAGEVETALASAAVGAARLRVLKDEAGEHGDVAAKLAFLVGREGFAEFRDAAEAVARKYERAGFRLELTGPWPAYNFAAGE